MTILHLVGNGMHDGCIIRCSPQGNGIGYSVVVRIVFRGLSLPGNVRMSVVKVNRPAYYQIVGIATIIF